MYLNAPWNVLNFAELNSNIFVVLLVVIMGGLFDSIFVWGTELLLKERSCLPRNRKKLHAPGGMDLGEEGCCCPML
ncbi:hypothetical protein RIF29_05376 [Crotalaria pallida]|uniref:Uncharacterized protein n=1 Tax=Crotalaria pallida TaxID=3830 RepID=A0AAN9J1Z0_CROPI